MKSKSNILIILCDQLSATALKAWGNKYSDTPVIDEIIESGVRFSQAYTNCPLCQPARASFWTSLYPHKTEILSNGRKHHVPTLKEDIPTLGTLFSDSGYKTIHFGKTHDAGSLRGFECVKVERPELDDAELHWPVNYDSQQDRDTREKVVNFLETYQEDKPYLAVADLNNPHDICNWIGENEIGDELLVFKDSELPPLPDNLYIDDEEFAKRPLPIQFICCAHNRQAQISEWSENKIRHYLKAYYHFLKRVDDEIGKILSALRKRPDADDTLIVFFVDHGDSMCGRWMGTKHTSFYDETTHVPFAFSGPGIAGKNRCVDGLVSLLDLLPTLCDYSGIAIPYTVEGQSLMPCLRGEKDRSDEKYVVSQWHTEWGFTIEPGRMLRTDRYKYTHYLEGEGEELYDLEKDPGETKNLIDNQEHQTVLDEHRALFKEYVEQTNDPYFSLEWLADKKYRSHKPGYRHHRGLAAPKLEEG